MASSLTLFCSFLFAASAAVISFVSATEYAVGGAVVGWRVPVINETQLYNVWASRRRFYVGDSLRFRYGFDSLMVVDKFGFYHCNSSNPIAFYNEGDDVINLDKPGPMYFTSGDSERCKQGLKMMVEVLSVDQVRHFPPPPPPPVSNPPYNNPSVAPSPSDEVLSPAPSPSDSVASVAVTNSVTALIVGLGLWALKA